jgi:hypothetical protein
MLFMLIPAWHAQEFGAKRLRSALSCCADLTTIQTLLVPFLSLLGSDALMRGTCRQPLIDLLQSIYQVPGFMTSLQQTLADTTKGSLSSEAGTAIGWLVLNVASQVEGTRADPIFLDFIEPLAEHGGGAAVAAAQLRVLLAAAIATADGGVAGDEEAGTAAVRTQGAADAADRDLLGVEDLLLSAAGGRHDNDYADYRAVKFMVTSDEVCSSSR